MLYIFHVDTGTMMTFDINLALESVVFLKSMIEKVCKIPSNKQVLLVSGGEVLRPDARVCSYSAGTDTNPIYMFSKTIIESDDPPKSLYDYSSDVDLKEQVDKCLLMAPSYNTVLSCAQLAQQFWDAAREHTHACEKLVHDQHLQQQGWAAVVANMEDVTMDFHERAEDFEEKFKEQISKKDEYIGFLSRFNDDLEILSSIPILPALRLNAVSNPFTAFDELHGDSESYDDDNQSIKEENEDEISCESNLPTLDGQKGFDGSSSSKGVGGSTTSEGDEGVELSKDGQKMRKADHGLVRTKSRQSNKEALTLLHWITVKENQESLKHIAEYCQNAMDLFDSNVMCTLRSDVAEALESAKRDNMKRIKGLEERLSGLEQLMCEARRLEQDQKDLAYAFQNKQSATSLTDIDVLRVLCESHRKQLQSMLRNHQRLYDMRRRCAKAKEELAINLYHRLQWIVYVENRMFEIDSKLMFYHRSLARLKRHLAVVGQLHRAPRLFCTAVHEIVRRRTFSQAFLSWASDLACHLLTIHSEEVMRRRSFDSLFSGHFLGGLFPGTEDMPPPFATQAPRGFDVELPRLTQNDIETLTARLPHLTPEIPPCDMTPVVQFFQLRSASTAKSVEKQVGEDKAPAVAKETVGLDRGFESETDTEEFENVGQSPIERGGGAAQLPAAPVRTDATTITEENLGSKRNEVENLKEMLSSVIIKYSETINILKTDMHNLKTDVTNHQESLQNDCIDVASMCEKHIAENALRERETLQRLTVDHELEMNDIQFIVKRKDEEILLLKAERDKCNRLLNERDSKINSLESRIQYFDNLCSEHAKIMEVAELSKQKAIKEIEDKMAQQYKGEVESLRSRFRLVALTSMDRSPSESSLEKIERTDMIEISNHKAILLQTRADFEQEKEEAIKEMVENLENEWKTKMISEIEKLKSKYESEKQINVKDAVKRIIEEKDKQLDHYRDRESTLLRECLKYKETIQQHTDPETSDFKSYKRIQLDASTSTDLKFCKKMIKSHTPLGLIPQTLTLSSCDVGDVVFVLWDGVHCNYTLLQESPTLYLLHSDCLSALDLKLNVKDESERRLYAVGRVENKEYCHAVKSGNKYQVAVSQRFYRVKVGPLKSNETLLKDRNYCCDNSSMCKDLESSQSKSVIRMSMSEAAGSYDSTTRSRRDNPMTKSVFPPNTLTASICDRLPVFMQLTNNPIIEDDSKLSSPIKSESKSSRIPTVDSAMISNVICDSNDNQKHAATAVTIEQKEDIKEIHSVNASDNRTEPIFDLSNTTAESVPYESSNNVCINDALSNELISEIAEEAAP